VPNGFQDIYRADQIRFEIASRVIETRRDRYLRGEVKYSGGITNGLGELIPISYIGIGEQNATGIIVQ
jgi:hypothetical protein